MSSSRNVPVGRVQRLAQLAGVGARTGVGLLLAPRTAAAAADHAAAVLGNLRGLATKVGQMASYVDGFVPEAQRSTFEAALKSLRQAAPSSSPEAVEHLVQAELGAPIPQLFRSWETTPFASASIGQVHRAELHDGREVAVKVQHPGIEQAIDSDLKNAGVLQAMIGSTLPKQLSPKAAFAEIQARFREELDYELEAERQRTFRAIHAGDADIVIPRVVESHSSRRVLTSELARGEDLDAASQRSEPERRHYAEVLWRFVFKSALGSGLFNADPHPGNYLFQPDGRIVFLDFGCVQPLQESARAAAIEMHLAAAARERDALCSAIARLLQTKGGAYEQHAIAYTLRCLLPLTDSPFRIDRTYVSSLVAGVHEMKSLLWQKGSGVVAPPADLLFLNRLQFGFYSVLARLDVRVDYAAVERGFLH